MYRFMVLAVAALSFSPHNSPMPADGESPADRRDKAFPAAADPALPDRPTDERRLQEFWTGYYQALKVFHDNLSELDWVPYYKGHGYRINAAAEPKDAPARYLPVFVSPVFQPATVNRLLLPGIGAAEHSPQPDIIGGTHPANGRTRTAEYEYRAVSFGRDAEESTRLLNQLAKDGWQYVGPLGPALVAFRRLAAGKALTSENP